MDYLISVISNKSGYVSRPLARDFLAKRKGYSIAGKKPRDVTIRKFKDGNYYLVGDRRFKKYRGKKRYTRVKNKTLTLYQPEVEDLAYDGDYAYDPIHDEEVKEIFHYGLFWEEEYGTPQGESFRKAVTILLIIDPYEFKLTEEQAEIILDLVKWKTAAKYKKFDFTSGPVELSDYPRLEEEVYGEIRVEFTFHDFKREKLVYGTAADVVDRVEYLRADKERVIEDMRKVDVSMMEESLNGEYYK